MGWDEVMEVGVGVAVGFGFLVLSKTWQHLDSHTRYDVVHSSTSSTPVTPLSTTWLTTEADYSSTDTKGRREQCLLGVLHG